MGNYFKPSLLIVMSLVLLGACSESRRGIKDDNLGGLEEVCAIQAAGLSMNNLGCFYIQRNLSNNSVDVSVLELGFDTSLYTYRFMARRSGDGQYVTLADNINFGAGTAFTSFARTGHLVEEYDAWRFELTCKMTQFSGCQFEPNPGQGYPIAWIEGITSF